MAHDVFISHAHENKPVADAAVAKLEAAGVRCWVAPRDLRPGETWPTAIPVAIRNARALVLVFSGRANASSHVSREVNLALEAGAPIIPIRIEDVTPDDSLSYALAGVHWLDALTEPLDVHLDAMTDIALVILDRQTSHRIPHPPSEQASQLASVGWQPKASAAPSAPLPSSGHMIPAKEWPTLQDHLGDLRRHAQTLMDAWGLLRAWFRDTRGEAAPHQPKQKSATVALILAVTLGWIGAHRFYLGKTGTGVAQALTFGGFFIWTAVDIINILSGRMTDAKGGSLAGDLGTDSPDRGSPSSA